MTVKLFLLGLPGSGKSTVARHIETYVRDRNFSATHFSDYAILREMFEEDAGHKQFELAEHGGFNVIDLTVFDTALKVLEQSIDEHMPTAGPREMILIEFARNNYHQAFSQFDQKFLQHAYFLYLAVDIETCKRRIRERVADPDTEDDYFASEYIFGTYYYKDDGPSIPKVLEEEYGIERQRVLLIDNTCPQQEMPSKIDPLIDIIITHESQTEIQLARQSHVKGDSSGCQS